MFSTLRNRQQRPPATLTHADIWGFLQQPPAPDWDNHPEVPPRTPAEPSAEDPPRTSAKAAHPLLPPWNPKTTIEILVISNNLIQ